MTGPEHYREAEMVIAQAKNRDIAADAASAFAAVAQVHATLALAASHADPWAHEDEWKQVTS